MRQNSKRNRQLVRESIHLPFYERIASRNGTTQNSSDVDPNEFRNPLSSKDGKDCLGNIDRFNLPEEIVRKCEKAFARFDLNHDGVIDLRELTQALVSMGFNPSEEEVRSIMDDVDQNGNEQLDFLEFLRVIQRQKDKSTKLTEEEKQEINIQEAWRALKSENTDTMDVAKFRDTLRSFDLAIDVDSLVRAMDVSENGVVDFEEFHGLFASSPRS